MFELWQFIHINYSCPTNIVFFMNKMWSKSNPIWISIEISFNLIWTSLTHRCEVVYSWKFNFSSHSNNARTHFCAERRQKDVFLLLFWQLWVNWNLSQKIDKIKMFDGYVFVDEIPKNDDFSVRTLGNGLQLD